MLARLLARGLSVVPIPGTTKILRRLGNLGADAGHFTSAELSEMNAALLRTPVHGAQLPAMALSLSGVGEPQNTSEHYS